MALDGEKKEIHVLMVAFAAQGHINPMLRLAKRLVSKGLHVTLATNEVTRHRMLHSPTASGIHLEFYSDGLPPEYDRKSNTDHYMEALAKFGPINLSTLVQNHCRNGLAKFSCIINNPFVPWAADVAAEHAIPCAMLWIQPCTLYAIYYRFYTNLNPFPSSENPNLTIEIPGLPLLHPRDLPSFILPSNRFESFPKLLSQVFKNLKNLKWVLTNSFYELENDVIGSMNEVHQIRPVGPLVPSSLLGEDDQELNMCTMDLYKSEDKCIAWLNQHPPSSVIYVSFGSIIEPSEKDMESIGNGLKNSKRPFLWVVKEGERKLQLGFLEEIKERGLIVKWSPQTEVLAHPSVGCFLSHCGWNSLLETMTAGVPVIAYPQWTDQPTNARLVADVWSVGVRITPTGDRVVRCEEVENCIEEIMSGPRSEQIRKRAAELKRAAWEALADGGSSNGNIQLFVDEIIGHSSFT